METISQPPHEIPGYYRSALSDEDARSSFKDLDGFNNFKEFENAVCNHHTRNFLIDFSDDEAWGAVNLSPDNIEDLLQAPRPSQLNTRWINIWLPHQQRAILTALAKHYDFTPRLLGLMVSTPARSKASSASTSRHSGSYVPVGFASHCSDASATLDKSLLDVDLGDEEKNGMISMEDLTKVDLLRNLNQYLLADDIWHYSSVDWDICIGYNTLHVVNCSDHSGSPHQDMPHGKRIWTWLLLGEDKTIVTISEDPFPVGHGVLTLREHRALGSIRRNLIHVVRQCSKAYITPDDLAATQLPIRKRLGDSEEETVHRSSDVPGLLFYYLFDDSFGTYSLIARRQNRYATELNRIRLSMLSKAQLVHVDRLHHIGRQLAVLKRIYQGYEMIIDRLLEKREPTLASLKASQAFQNQEDSPTDSQIQMLAESQYLIGVSLSSAARVRFERLKHNIRLYAISEIEECLALKDALVMMNFNLIAIKETFSVERLTRVTLLLGKTTLLFMPISVMTGYFSCQLIDVQFTVRSYWSWFAGVLCASIVALFIFSAISGTMDTAIIYRPMSRRMLDFVATVYRRLRKIQELDEDE